MKKARESESKGVYPVDSKLIIYRHLLSILYQQNKISKATYTDSVAYIEQAVMQHAKNKAVRLLERRNEDGKSCRGGD